MTPTQTSLSRKRKTFYLIAQRAIANGLLLPQERDLICRKGTRKAGYWARHVRNLLEVLADRQRQREAIGGDLPQAEPTHEPKLPQPTVTHPITMYKTYETTGAHRI